MKPDSTRAIRPALDLTVEHWGKARERLVLGVFGALPNHLASQGDLTGTGGLGSRRPGARLCVMLKSDSHPQPGRGQPKRPFPPPRGPLSTDRPGRRNSTGCKTALNDNIVDALEGALARVGGDHPFRGRS